MTRATLLINIIIWIYLSIGGIAGYVSISDQNVQGYPNFGQLTLYIIFPVVLFLTSLCLIFLHRKIENTWLLYVAGFISVAFLLAVFPYLLVSRGGV